MVRMVRVPSEIYKEYQVQVNAESQLRNGLRTLLRKIAKITIKKIKKEELTGSDKRRYSRLARDRDALTSAMRTVRAKLTELEDEMDDSMFSEEMK